MLTESTGLPPLAARYSCIASSLPPCPLDIRTWASKDLLAKVA